MVENVKEMEISQPVGIENGTSVLEKSLAVS